ncbi:hypothetical protein RHGRI_031139 [Rhododendron griersonianum]|uniref:Plastidal glycolate/glycerate translocator 1, chloroplastic n=1 Tax=Rhododendron griersonianum TaxID=479676 RepID=A0AAV6I7H5_9ERIC|nr:hypothetical protein RHGRI_031139 [Rhododendron griersonianum]
MSTQITNSTPPTKWETLPLSSLHSLPMAAPSVVPRNPPFSLTNHHPSRIFSLNHLTFSRKYPTKIHPKIFPVAFNGVRISHNQPNPRETAKTPARALGPNPHFLQLGPHNTHSTRRIHAKSMGSDSSFSSRSLQSVLHLVVSLGIILAMDKVLKKAFVAAAIKFPSALFGMFCVFTILMVLDSTIPAAATSLMNFFEPALLFIQRWLPLFYVPSLVVLPLAVKDIPAASGVKISLIIVGGWLASLSVAGFTAIAVRKMHSEQAQEHAFHFYLLLLCLAIWLPSDLKKVFHPIICCALSADIAALAFAYLSNSGIDPVLVETRDKPAVVFTLNTGYYLTKVSSNPGAGDILMGFLGSVIISFAFSMFKQRKLVKRHSAEIFTSVVISTVFSLYSTALIGRLVGLEPSLTISILPRCANSSLTAAVVVLTGLVGANFVQAMLDKLRFDDPIARGIATASRYVTSPQRWQLRFIELAHGLGTAALSAKEPEALPFCAIAYALTGIFGSLLCSVPAVRQSLLAVVG